MRKNGAHLRTQSSIMLFGHLAPNRKYLSMCVFREPFFHCGVRERETEREQENISGSMYYNPV